MRVLRRLLAEIRENRRLRRRIARMNVDLESAKNELMRLKQDIAEGQSRERLLQLEIDGLADIHARTVKRIELSGLLNPLPRDAQS